MSLANNKKLDDSIVHLLASQLINAKNIILRGAPGTGKSFLAKQIAAYIVSKNNNVINDYELLTEEQKTRIEFVQFHPSYDYSDFVEGLRPFIGDDGSIGFKVTSGIFKNFVKKAILNYENSIKTIADLKLEQSIDDEIDDFIENQNINEEYTTNKGIKFFIENITDERIDIKIPSNKVASKVIVYIDELKKLLKSKQVFEKPIQLKTFFDQQNSRQRYTYTLSIYQRIIATRKQSKTNSKIQKESLNNYVFIIDEINRGDISKIFGELFFTIDPGYRGKKGEICTQYSNMHKNESKFYIPKNVYIIGTMNDIDRSVDSFDFAMRRRFRFIEISAQNSQQMLFQIKDLNLRNSIIKKMNSLNTEISNTEGLNNNYHIGAAYFLKLNNENINFDILWSDYLEPLLHDYIQGMPNEKKIMTNFKNAYDGKNDET